MEIELTILPPSECEIEDIRVFEQVVVAGEQVQSAGLADRINEAFVLAFAKEGNKIVGTAALKIPRPDYAKKVFQKAGVIDLLDQYKYELGWIVTLPNYEGNKIGQRLIQQIINKYGTEKIFATTKNDVMRYIFEKSDFTKAGSSYFNDANEKLDLYFLNERG